MDAERLEARPPTRKYSIKFFPLQKTLRPQIPRPTTTMVMKRTSMKEELSTKPLGARISLNKKGRKPNINPFASAIVLSLMLLPNSSIFLATISSPGNNKPLLRPLHQDYFTPKENLIVAGSEMLIFYKKGEKPLFFTI
jgi:hypothetical protein